MCFIISISFLNIQILNRINNTNTEFNHDNTFITKTDFAMSNWMLLKIENEIRTLWWKWKEINFLRATDSVDSALNWKSHVPNRIAMFLTKIRFTLMHIATNSNGIHIRSES